MAVAKGMSHACYEGRGKNMAIGGSKFWRFGIWVAKKKLQVFVRSHLSHVLAATLALLVLYREREELLHMFSRQRHVSGLGWLVLLVTAGTMAAALWEFWGNKLTTSPQEVAFLQGIRSLLFELEKFGWGKDRIADPEARLSQFVQGVLEVACQTLCGRRHVDAGLMVKDPSAEALKLSHSSKEANYPRDLLIPLPTDQNEATGPAGWCFQQLHLVYVPVKRRRESWPFELMRKGRAEWYEPSQPLPGWISAPPEQENFKSALCVPVAIYQEKDRKKRRGVINFSASARDPFVDRDFMMAECFASILGYAFEVAQAEIDAKVSK